MAATSGLTLKALGLEAPVGGTLAGELTPEDILSLATAEAPKGVTAPQRLKKVRAVHHQAARLVATGMPPQQVSLAVGWAPSRVYLLKDDPAFQELVAFYMKQESELSIDVRSRMLSLGLDAVSELHDRLEDDPESMSNKTLLEIATMALDRSGHQPGRSASGSSALDSSDIKTIKEAAASRERGRVFEYVPQDSRPPVGAVRTEEPVATKAESIRA